MNILNPGSIIGIIGGGQLGRMTAIAAANLGYKVHIYCNSPENQTSQVANFTTIASYSDRESLIDFAKSVDVVTFEFENIPFSAAKIIEEYTLVKPKAEILHICQNRLREKEFARNCGIKTANFSHITNIVELQGKMEGIGFPAILKTCELGYDGKGQYRINTEDDVTKIVNAFENQKINMILESFVDFEKEISVIVAQNEDGESVCFEPVENKHKNGILDITICPANIETKISEKAKEKAKLMAEKLGLIGLLTIEYFVDKNGELIFNEMAPRPHNSGHFTIDACITSQFEQLIRAITNIPFGSTKLVSKIEMKNLIGYDIMEINNYFSDPTAKVHIYGKEQIKEGRKMGHVTKILDDES